MIPMSIGGTNDALFVLVISCHSHCSEFATILIYDLFDVFCLFVGSVDSWGWGHSRCEKLVLLIG